MSCFIRLQSAALAVRLDALQARSTRSPAGARLSSSSAHAAAAGTVECGKAVCHGRDVDGADAAQRLARARPYLVAASLLVRLLC